MHRVARAEAAQELAARNAAKVAAQDAAEKWERDKQTAVDDAADAGLVSKRQAHRDLEHGRPVDWLRTPAEFVADAFAVQEAEDRAEEWRLQAKYRAWLRNESEENSADMTAPAAPTQRQREALAAGDVAVHDEDLLRRADRRAEKTSIKWAHSMARGLRGELGQ